MAVKKIGIIVADTDEYRPLAGYLVSYGAAQTQVAGKTAHRFTVISRCGECDVTSVLCGIGKVNAASAAAALCEKGAEIIINFGLSGGVSGVSRNSICVPTKFLEHDFDLTGIGYKPCEKPGQEYIFSSCTELSNLLLKSFEGAVKGTAVTGDSFVQSEEKKNFLKNTFSATCCDMETAAIAGVCADYKVKFGCVRRISDDAGSSAAEDYRAMNELAEDVLVSGVLNAISQL